MVTSTCPPLTPTAPGNADGTRIVFVSNLSLIGGNNVGDNNEIFLWTQGAGFTQITNTTGGFNRTPSISADGTRIAFPSDRDLAPGANPDSNFEIFWIQGSPGSGITQVTHTTGEASFDPSISANGSMIAFPSRSDLVPGSPGNADGSYEIFWASESGSGITQITDSIAGHSGNPSISADGSQIAFVSTSNLTGNNAGIRDELFLATLSATLTITKTGTGTGTVASGDSLHCGLDCEASYVAGTTVFFTVLADPGSVFSGWSGDPGCADGTPTIVAHTHCIATFNLADSPDLTGTWNPVSQSCDQEECKLKDAVRVLNQGTATAAASRLRVLLSTDAVLDPNDTVLKESKIKKLKPGREKTLKVKVKVKLPSGVSAAGKYLFAVLDALDSVAETNETNNGPMTGPMP